MTDRQIATLGILKEKHGVGTNAVGFRLRSRGFIKKTVLGSGNLVLPAESILRSLERRELVTQGRSDNTQWAIKIWFLTQAGEELLSSLTTRS